MLEKQIYMMEVWYKVNVALVLKQISIEVNSMNKNASQYL